MNAIRTAGTNTITRDRSRRGAIWKVSLIVMIAIVVLTCAGAAPVRAASLSMNRQQLVLFTGQHASLTVNGKKKGKLVKWRSSDKKIVRVDQKGTVTAVKKGKAAITARIGKMKLSCKVQRRLRPDRSLILTGPAGH